jgi:hypothetical protein
LPQGFRIADCSRAIETHPMTLIAELERTRDETLRFFTLGEEELALTYGPGKWSVRYVLLHLTHSETTFIERIQRTLSEPRPVLWFMHQELWASALEYDKLPLDLAGRLYEASRNMLIYYAREYYESRGHLEFIHSVTGLRTLKGEFDKVAAHNENHLNQIRTALGAPAAAR